jgi:hypothetical protein
VDFENYDENKIFVSLVSVSKESGTHFSCCSEEQINCKQFHLKLQIHLKLWSLNGIKTQRSATHSNKSYYCLHCSHHTKKKYNFWIIFYSIGEVPTICKMIHKENIAMVSFRDHNNQVTNRSLVDQKSEYRTEDPIVK